MFDFQATAGGARVLCDGCEVLELIQEHLWFRGFRLANLRFYPGGPVECIGLHASCFYYNNLLRARIESRQLSPTELELTLTPEKVEGDLLDKVDEVRVITLRWDEAAGRLRYQVKVRLRFLQDVPADAPGLPVTPMAQWNDDHYAVVEIDDPLLGGGKGPQVPMTQDWVGIQEPWFDEACFTSRWQRRYHGVILHTAERGVRKIEFNRAMNSEQQFYNRHVLKSVPRTPFYYEKTDGRFLVFQPDFDYPCGHHICEWGYDMHWYALLERADEAVLFARGREWMFRYEISEVAADQLPAAYRNAPVAELEPNERERADRPIYEEPVCRFQRSALEHPDACRWLPEGQCVWNRDGAAPKSGALEIHHGEQAARSSWRFAQLGPSYGCNPIPPQSRFRISAWIEADEPEQVKLIHTLKSHHGPAMVADGISTTVSTGTWNDVEKQEGKTGTLSFVTIPSGAYCLDGSIEFVYTGRGSARMSLLSIVRL